MRFKINFGVHRQRSSDGKMVVFKAGDIVETTEDLASVFPIVDVERNLPRYVLVDDDESPAKPVFKSKKGKK